MTEPKELSVQEIGEAAGLVSGRLEMYMQYVNKRFHGRHPSYITEWATRFADGDEFRASDAVGQAMLLRMYKGEQP